MNSLITGSCLLHFSEGFHPHIVQAVHTSTANQSLLSKNDWSSIAFGEKIGAGDGDRTRDVQLGKLAFYR